MTEDLLRILEEEARRADTEAQWPAKSVKTLADSGLLGLTLSREDGGEGSGMRDFAKVVEQIASRCASTAMIYVMHVCGAQAIAASKSPLRAE